MKLEHKCPLVIFTEIIIYLIDPNYWIFVFQSVTPVNAQINLPTVDLDMKLSVEFQMDTVAPYINAVS